MFVLIEESKIIVHRTMKPFILAASFLGPEQDIKLLVSGHDLKPPSHDRFLPA